MAAVQPSPNKNILDEVNEAGNWARAKKTRPIWARLVEQDQMVLTLEGTEAVKAGDYLCRGEIGEVWPQTAASLERKYTPTDDVDESGWRRFVPSPDAEGVMAAQVEHAFTVHASWGVLKGKAGDFIVKNFSDKEVDHPTDVWIVDQQLFHATYEPSQD